MFDYPIFSTQMCSCRPAEDDKRVKEDCYWYDEEQDMGAHIPFCKCKGTFPLENCGGCEHYHSRYKRTNADRIRAMTDEELAKKISGIEQFALTVDGAWSSKQWLKWLKQEA